MMVASIGSLTILNGAGQFAAIVFAEHYKMPSAFAINSAVLIALTLILFVSLPKLVGKLGKRNLILATASFSLIATCLLLFVDIKNVYVFIAVYNIATIGALFFNMTVWALVTDCLDFTELKTGKRYDGTLYAIYAFSRKIGMGFGAAIGSFALGWAGFVSGATSQSAEVAANVAKLYVLVPAIAFVFMLVGIGLIYNLNNKKTNEMYKTLEERRAAALEKVSTF